jgi:uncharacterized DUF497 family protein
MQFEWNARKHEQNLAKHGVGFDSIYDFDWDHAVIAPDQRRVYGEQRLIAFGSICGRIYICVYTMRGETRRIISLRKANAREEKIYEEETKTVN